MVLFVFYMLWGIYCAAVSIKFADFPPLFPTSMMLIFGQLFSLKCLFRLSMCEKGPGQQGPKTIPSGHPFRINAIWLLNNSGRISRNTHFGAFIYFPNLSLLLQRFHIRLLSQYTFLYFQQVFRFLRPKIPPTPRYPPTFVFKS